MKDPIEKFLADLKACEDYAKKCDYEGWAEKFQQAREIIRLFHQEIRTEAVRNNLAGMDISQRHWLEFLDRVGEIAKGNA